MRAVTPPPTATDAPPSLRRRLAALVYESLLLFGVVFLAALAFGIVFQQHSGLDHRRLLAAWIALVAGAYFVWFWTHGGQTLPMKTWRLRVETAGGAPLSFGRAIARYALGWLWFLPPLALHPLAGFPLPRTLAAAAVWFALWVLAARVHPSRQFPHDRLAGTCIVDVPRAGKVAA